LVFSIRSRSSSGKVPHWSAAKDAGVDDDDVQPPEPIDRRGDGGAYGVRIGAVGLDRQAFAALGFNRLHRLRRLPRGGHIGQGDVGAIPGQPARHRGADAASAAKNDGDPSLQFAILGHLSLHC